MPGLESAKFQAAPEQKTYADQVKEGRRKGEQLEIDQTPTLYFNGIKYKGRISYDDYLATVKTHRTMPQPAKARE